MNLARLRALTLGSTLLSAIGTSAALAEEKPAAAPDAPAKPVFTGHIDLVSKYILRGASTTYGNTYPGGTNVLADAPESDQPVLQWGVDYVLPNGFYLGYWASRINYSYKRLGESYSDRTVSNFQDNKSIENDIYGGYSGSLGAFTYTLGLIGYVYINGKHADAVETRIGLGYGPFAVNAQTLLNDVVWGNRRDTYWTLNYTHALPFDINFTGSLGYYTYAKEGKFLGTRDTFSGVDCAPNGAFIVNGCYVGNRPISGGFRHLILGVTGPIGASGFVWGLQGLIPGETRYGVRQAGRLIGSLGFTF